MSLGWLAFSTEYAEPLQQKKCELSVVYSHSYPTFILTEGMCRSQGMLSHQGMGRRRRQPPPRRLELWTCMEKKSVQEINP